MDDNCVVKFCNIKKTIKYCRLLKKLLK
jgi:hypothetical protein